MKKKIFVVFAILVFEIITVNLLAQIPVIISNQKKLEATPEMIMQVKQFNQFIERFNYQRTFDDKPVDSVFSLLYPRDQYLLQLFNSLDKRFDATVNDDYKQVCSSFIATITNKSNPVYVHRESEKLYAQALCLVNYKGKEQTMELVLQNRYLADQSLEWKIVGVNAGFLELDKTVTGYKQTIPPNAQETNFMVLKKTLNSKSNLLDLVSNDFTYNPMSIFLHGIYNGDITFNYVREVSFYILEIEGWIVCVKEFQRNTLNSGWLIHDILPANEPAKMKFVAEKLYIGN